MLGVKVAAEIHAGRIKAFLPSGEASHKRDSDAGVNETPYTLARGRPS
jgi:hypothetical protein